MRAASGRLWIAWVASSLAFLLAACPGGVVEVPDAGDGADAGEDGGPDAGEDTGPDAGEDAGPDAGEDADGAVDPPTCWDAIPPLDEVAFWVAPDGDDQADGSQATPFRSLERARQAVRVRLDAGDVPAGGLTVVLRGGDYPMATGVRLEAADSGPDAARPVRYRGHPGERARLTGAAPLEPAWFAPLEAGDPDHARLPEAARAEVRVVDLTAHGLSDHGTLRRRGFGTWGAVSALELYYQGEAMELARWPNRGQTDPPEPAHPARVRGDLFGAGVDFAYLGTAGVGNADDGYPAYAGQAAGRTFYLYHCTC